MKVTGVQVRAARQLLEFSAERLAEKAKITRAQLANFESGRGYSTDVYDSVVQTLTDLNIRFLASGGVDIAKDELMIFEGNDHYIDILDHAHRALRYADDKSLLLLFASDALSSQEIVEKYREMRRDGIVMRQIISEEDNYILGSFHEYRQISSNVFTGLLTVIYDNIVVQSSPSDYKSIALIDSGIANSHRSIFEIIWQTGKTPTFTTTEKRFE